MTHKPFLYLTAASAIFLLPGAPLLAQMTGVSNPDAVETTITTSPATSAHYTKPAAATPVSLAPTLQQHPGEAPIVYGEYKPFAPAHAAAPTAPALQASNTSVVYGPYRPYRPAGDAIGVPGASGEIASGTEVKAYLQQPISTLTTHEGAHFTAIVKEDISSNGVVLVPAGSIVKGRITRVHGGRRITGAPVIRLQPDAISMADGSSYKLSAEVTALDHFSAAHVNREGSIVGDTSGKNTALGFGLLTSTSTVSGAVIGGGVGAAVGAGIGAGLATVWWLKQIRLEELPSGTAVVFTLNDNLKINAYAL